ncbi:MAG: tetratricopeptide repeat protein [Epsilonproteobacteria bacterium]|nr:tetratricopeptide repeat protein [Campylobacterota bacterium]
MKRSTALYLLSAAIPFSIFSAEPSAFGAGNLSSSNPYGLTPDEKLLLETKQKLKKVDISTKTHASQLDSLRERIDGLQDIVEALSRKSHNNKIKLQELQSVEMQKGESEVEYQKRVANLVEENAQKITLLENNISSISKEVEFISKNYVSKEEYNRLVDEINNFKALISKELVAKKTNLSGKKRSSAAIYNSAKRNFNKKYYTKAINEYKELISRNYKPAYSHYMIGEMWFKRKDYGKAIIYFKKSSQLYSKAKYMPTLMLHTAISMDKTGDKTNAKAFAKALILKYPNSKEAKEARKILD